MKKKVKKKIIKKTVKKTPKKKVIVKKLETEKQKKLFKLISENFGKSGGTKTMQEMMISAGYSETTSKQQTAILCKIKESEEYKDYIAWIEKHRKKIMKKMDDKIGSADYGELSRTFARLENILLLSQGKPTSNINVLSEEEKKDLDKLADDNA